MSVARALREKDINARVTEVRTQARRRLASCSCSDLPLKATSACSASACRCRARRRERIQLSDEWRYAQLATLVESWGYRASLDRERLLSRRELAILWFDEEYEPIVGVLREAGLGGGGTETERYLRIAMLRFLLLQTHDWSDEIAERLAGEVRSPSAGVGEGHDDPPDPQGAARLESTHASHRRRRGGTMGQLHAVTEPEVSGASEPLNERKAAHGSRCWVGAALRYDEASITSG